MDVRHLQRSKGRVQSTIRFERGYSPLLPAREAASMSKDQKINDQEMFSDYRTRAFYHIKRARQKMRNVITCEYVSRVICF